MRTLRFLLVLCLAAPASRAAAQTTAPPVKESTPGLFRAAKLTPDSALATVQRMVPRGQVLSGELERESGRLVYSFDIKDGTRPGVREIWLDAATGRVVSDRRESDAAEAAERAKDASAKRQESAPKPHTP